MFLYFLSHLFLHLFIRQSFHRPLLLGVEAEAVVFAASLSLNSSLFRRANFTHKDPEEFNGIVRGSFLGDSAALYFNIITNFNLSS